MSVVSVRARSFILALFIRDDGERFLLGDRGFDFKDSQLHFSANTIENDEVEKQGVDGVMLAGQVRRASVQSFDGYVGDGTTLKEEVEQMRRDFIAFFAKGHHFRVIYIDCNRNAWQRKGGYLVDAPEVKELWQIHPEYHVGLNFEDVNYYEYDENAEGEEILSNIISVPISSDVEGGLVWDENGAVSEPEEIEYDTETATASGTNISIADAVEAPLASFQLDGETSQNGTPTPDAPVAVQTVTGENVVKICGKNLCDGVNQNYWLNAGAYSAGQTTGNSGIGISVSANTDYTISTKVSQAHYRAAFVDSLPTSNAGIAAYSGKAKDGTSSSITINSGSHGYLIVNATSLSDIQIELGSTATAYEPYQGQSYEVNLGKNLFDKDNASEVINAFIDYGATAHKIYTNSSCRLAYIRCEPNTTYTISKTLSARFVIATTSEVPANNVSVSQDIAKNTDTTYTITTNSTAKYLCVFLYHSSYDTLTPEQILATLQIEKGSDATSYAAYFEPIELCKIGNYQDYIYKSGGKWYVHKEVGKVVLNGSESNWTRGPLSGDATYRFFVTISGIKTTQSQDSLGLVLSDKLIEVTNGSQYSGTEGIRVRSNGAEQLSITTYATQTMTVDNFKTWLAANNIIAYYALATPTDTEITNEALVAQLEAILDGGTSAGTNNITTIISAGNAQGELEITYYTKYDAKVVGGGYVWEAGGSGGPTIVTNESISAVSPVWTVFGPALNPMLENTTTGEQIQYVGMISEGQTLVVDMGEQTASLDGLNVISNIVGEYLTLAPGSNTLLFSADSDAPASEIGWSEIVG